MDSESGGIMKRVKDQIVDVGEIQGVEDPEVEKKEDAPVPAPAVTHKVVTSAELIQHRKATRPNKLRIRL
jgi:hypothetical protein